jgi:hypothetical protein
MKRVSRKKKHEQSFKPKDAIFSPLHAKFTMQLSSETKYKMKGFFFFNAFKMRSKHNPVLIPFSFSNNNAKQWKEIKRPS